MEKKGTTPNNVEILRFIECFGRCHFSKGEGPGNGMSSVGFSVVRLIAKQWPFFELNMFFEILKLNFR